jgi:hypothetical protein
MILASSWDLTSTGGIPAATGIFQDGFEIAKNRDLSVASFKT